MLAGVTCPVCGREGPGRCSNYWCRQGDRCFDAVFAVGAYDPLLRRALVRYKYQGDRRLSMIFASRLAGFLMDHEGWFEEFDVLTSAPAFVGAGARRSWDHVASIVADAAPLLRPFWSVEPRLVVKRFETPALTGRSVGGRRSVARGPLRRSLAMGEGAAVSGSRVLVLDDVMTEGSTLRETARLLRMSGASSVAAVVLGRPAWGGPAGPPSARAPGAQVDRV
jgi:predicted amidophosphoribosyltransferase